MQSHPGIAKAPAVNSKKIIRTRKREKAISGECWLVCAGVTGLALQLLLD